MDNSDIIFRAINISKTIKNKLVINDLSLNLFQNEIFGLLGLNGAGKTTLIKLFTKLLNLDSGCINLLGYDSLNDFEEYIKCIGVSFDNPSFYENLSGYKNLQLIGHYYSLKNKNYFNELNAELLQKKVSSYSMGIKQKLNIEQAMIHSPKLLILDEPTNGLDPKAVRELRERLKLYKKKHKATILISSHNLSEVENLCDRIGILDNGKLLKIYNTDEMHSLCTKNNLSLEDIFLQSIEQRVNV